MSTLRLVPEEDWTRVVNALEEAIDALRRCGSMTLPDVSPTKARSAGATRRAAPVSRSGAPRSRARSADGVALARKVVDQVAAGGPRHVPTRSRNEPTLADFVELLANGRPFRAPDLVEPLRQYVKLKDNRRLAGSQIRTALYTDGRFRKLDDGRWSAMGRKDAVPAAERGG